MKNYLITRTGMIINKKTGHEWYDAYDVAELYAMFDSGKFYLIEIANWLGFKEHVVRNIIRRRNEIEPIIANLPKQKYEWMMNPRIV